MSKKILITTESLTMGGVETVLLSILKFLNQCDVEIDLYVLKEGVLKEEFKKLNHVNLISTKIPKNKILYRILKNIKCKSLYRNYLKQAKKEYDIAIAFYGINNYCDMYAAASGAHKKFIWVHNNFETSYQNSKHRIVLKIRNQLIRKKFDYFDQIVAVSESAKQGFLTIFPEYKNGVIVINNFLDIERLKMQYEPCDFKMEGHNNLIYVGRLVSLKQVDLLIKEFEKVLLEIPASHLYIIGDGEERKNLEQLVCEKKLVKNVTFLGNQNNPFQYMAQADIVVTASGNETYSTNVLEAMAMRKYFVSADNGGAEDIFYLANQTNLNNGIVCKVEHMHHYIINYLKHRNCFSPSFDLDFLNETIQKNLLENFDISKL